MSFAIHKNRRGGSRPQILSVAYHGSWDGSSSNLSTYNFNSRGVGPSAGPGERRFLIGFGHVVRSGSVDIDLLKINGVTATALLAAEQGNTAALIIGMREVASGTVANLSIELSNAASFASGAFLSIITNGANLQKINGVTDDTTPYSLAYNGDAGDAIIAASTLQQAGPHSWSGPAAMSERYDGVVQSGYSSAFAGLLSVGGSGAVTCTVTSSPSTRIGGLVSLRPVAN